jgi:HSP20 family protein
MKTALNSNRNLFPALPSLIEDFFNRNWMETPNGNRLMSSTMPAVNVYETNESFEIQMAAPGMKRENFNIQFDNYVLTISAEAQEQEQKEDDQLRRREFLYTSFERSFALPENQVDGEKIQAKYVDGILHITVPKKEEARQKPARQIAIS